MIEEGTVVVIVRPRTFYSGTARGYAAEIVELGLGVYGASPDEARGKLHAMFRDAVCARRKLGRLAAWLNHSGLTWWWEKDYGGPLPVIQASGTIPAEADEPHDLLMAA